MQTIRTNDLASATGGAALWAPRFGYNPYAGYYSPYAYPAYPTNSSDSRSNAKPGARNPSTSTPSAHEMRSLLPRISCSFSFRPKVVNLRCVIVCEPIR